MTHVFYRLIFLNESEHATKANKIKKWSEKTREKGQKVQVLDNNVHNAVEPVSFEAVILSIKVDLVSGSDVE